MTIRKMSLLAVFACFSGFLTAQATADFTEAQLAYKRGEDFFRQGIYGLAQKEFRESIRLVRPVNDPEWRNLRTDAELQNAKCAVRLKQPEATKLVEDFLRENSPSPQASQAALEVANYFFDQKEYEKALDYYAMTPRSGMTRDMASEVRFKEGYAYFLAKKFPQAKTAFSSVKELTASPFYHQANYYYGCIAFYEQKYGEALKHFQRVEQSPKYKATMPYLLTQIYFAQKQYDKVIEYAAPKAKDGSIKNSAELNLLVGQAYFEKGDYKNALPYLEYGAKNASALRPSDYYQVGYAQYQTGAYKAAITNFENLTKQDSLLGQNGLYHLGDCYLKTGKKQAARNAFGQASQMNFDKTVKEEALFNYAKLSYELKYDRDALTAFQSFSSDSKYYQDAQALMGELFLNTRDYERAIQTIEGLKTRNQKINESYQKVCYLRGLQLIQDKKRDQAEPFFQKSLQYTYDKPTEAQANFWLGEIAHTKGDYEKSRNFMSQFLSKGKSMTLPDESSIHMGNYIQGYNLLKLKDHSSALDYFTQCVNGIKRSTGSMYSEEVKKSVLGDAVLRAGDCHFKRNQYDSALKYYNEAVSNQYTGYVYALYQKAIIEGLKKNPLDKIIALEKLVKNYPNSEYADESLLQIGITYQEMNKLDEAVPPLKKLVADYRGKSDLVTEALLQLGIISYNQGRQQEAINYYKQVFANNPDAQAAKDALAGLEEIYVRDLGKPDEYFAFLETVPGYKVNQAEKENVSFQAAESQFENGSYERAVEGYTAYLAKYPSGANSLTAYYHRADAYSAQKKYPQALKDYVTVVNRGPSKHYEKSLEKASALAFNHEKDYAQAFELYKKMESAATSDEMKFEATLGCLRCAYRLNRSTDVQAYANKVITSGAATKEQLAGAHFVLGKQAFDQKNWAAALSSYRKVVDLSNNENAAEARYSIAYCLYQQRDLDGAEEAAFAANKANSGYPDWIARSLMLVSDIYVERKDYETAETALETLIEKYDGGNAQILAEAKAKLEKVKKLTNNPNLVRPNGNNSGRLELDDN